MTTKEKDPVALAQEVVRLSDGMPMTTQIADYFMSVAPALARASLDMRRHLREQADSAIGHRQAMVRAARLIKGEYQRGWKECRDGVLMTLSTYREGNPSHFAILSVLDDLDKLEKLSHELPPEVDVPPPDASDPRACIVSFLRRHASKNSTEGLVESLGTDLVEEYANRIEARQDMLPAFADFTYTGDVRKDAMAVDAILRKSDEAYAVVPAPSQVAEIVEWLRSGEWSGGGGWAKRLANDIEQRWGTPKVPT